MQNYTINPVTRVIEIPKGTDVLGVFHDNNVDGAHFIIEGEIVSKLKNASDIYINLITASSDEPKRIPVTNLVKTDASISFDWILTRFATANAGSIPYIVCFKFANDDEWNTTIARGRILEGIEPGDIAPDEPPEEEDATPDGRGDWY